MTNNETIFKEIDSIIDKVHKHKVEPDFSNEIAQRNSRKAPDKISDDDLLRIYATLLAFSRGANSKFVNRELITSGKFEEMFQNFSVDKVALFDVDEFLKKHWIKPLTYIRMKSKVVDIIKFAKKIKELGSLSSILTNSNIPKRIQSQQDISSFWTAFDMLQITMKEKEIPYLQSTTTLLHYLLDTGYDCIKPDSAVMDVSERVGIVASQKGDLNLRKTVDTLFHYSISRNLRPGIVDLYFLIAKPQEGAKHYVHSNFY